MNVGTFGVFKTGSSVCVQNISFGPQNDVVMWEDSTSESDYEVCQPSRVLTPLTPLGIAGQRPTFTQRRSDAEAEGHEVERPRMKKTGKRRKRQFMNKYFLNEQLQQFLPTDVEDAKEQWHILFAPHHESVFQQLLESPAGSDLIDPFVDISMDAEPSLFRRMTKQPIEQSVKEQRDPESQFCSLRRYNQLPKELRKVLRKHQSSDLLLTLQQSFEDFITTDAASLDLTLEEHERILCHAVTTYYFLISTTQGVVVDEGEGSLKKYCVRVTKRKRTPTPRLPHQPLHEFLRDLKTQRNQTQNPSKPDSKRSSKKKKKATYRQRFHTTVPL
eukprot:NODE_862_length_1271_cov_228.210311_g657_i0.p1 GENE.NODE_862_length_1271_cov_228.210311_g657_i0~~NODE_862_length_1271_cov_228.210311_g657_i0.p1  ORF type:complete len:349 (+),score=88.35 NODE_862_length_1271_cov_228.210311_g657_i0:59-1048(+)